MAIETEARFEAQRITGAKADRLDVGISEQSLRQRHDIARSDRDFEAVLTGVTRPRDMTIHAVEFGGGGGHEGEFRRLGTVARQHGSGFRTLQSDQSAILRRLERNVLGQMLLQPGIIDILARGIHHDAEPAVIGRHERMGDHQIIDDAALRIGDLGVANATRR